jgi:hypothetical protein
MGAVIRQRGFIAVVGTFLFGCAVLLMVAGCAGVRSEASKQEEEQGHTEATTEQTRSDRCEGTRTYKNYRYWTWSHPPKRWRVFTTNDVPGCPSGGLLTGTGKKDALGGKGGDDEIHGLGDPDTIDGGGGNDVIYGGPGGDESLSGDDGDDVIYGGDGDDFLGGGAGEDVLYGGDGNDALNGTDEGLKDTQRDELYCGPGKDVYDAGKLDYVDSSCEKKVGLVGRQ